LLAEDSLDDADLLMAELRRAGFEPNCKRVQTEPDFLAGIKNLPDIVLSDYAMPQFNGLRAAELLQASGLDIPFILISGTIGEDTAVEAMQRGVTDYLLKDRLARLGGAVEQALEKKRLREERQHLEVSLKLFRALVDRCSDSIQVIDPETTRFLDVNETTCERLGYQRAEMLAMSVLDVHADDVGMNLSVWRAHVAKTRQSGSEILETRSKRKDGSTFPVEVNVRFVKLDREYMIASVRDITERRQIEDALHKLSQRTERRERILTTTLSNLHDFAYIFDRDGRFVFANQPLLDLWGITLEAAVGKNFFDLKYPDELAGKLQRQIQQVFDTKQSVTDETPYTSPAGQPGFYEYIFSPAFAADGTVDFVAGSTRDITARKHTEKKLRDSEERFSSAFEFAPIGIALVSPEGRWLKVNRAICELVGYSEAELLARTFQDITHPDDLAADLENVRRLLAGEIRFYEMEKRYIHARGHSVAILLDVSLVRDAQNKPLYFIAQIQDITERKRTAGALLESQRFLRSTLDALTSHIAILDEHGTIIEVNAAWNRLAGGNNFIGTNYLKVCDSASGNHSKEATEVADGIRAIIAGQREEFQLEYPCHSPNEKRWFLVRVTRFGGDGPVRAVVAHENITERKKLEGQLVQSQKLETVGKLAGGIAHEFNSILTAIIGQSELLLADLPAQSPFAKNATEITKAANRAATLTRQLLAYGRKQLLQPESLDLNRVVAGMETMFQNLMGADVEVQLVPAADLHLVKADAGQIEQVIMNLIINARDAMPNGGKLILETANVVFDPESIGRFPELKPGDYVMLAISDTGTGMSDAVKARVFEPFFSTKGVGQGTGLGLSTCYGIVKQSGGHISVYSELGRGTTFKIYLPQVEASATISLPRPDAPDLPLGTETILLVEDDPALREMAATLLTRLGYTVLTAGNGVEALNLRHERGSGQIDLLFTDVVMPHMSGKELADRVRALYPQTKILFTSAYTENAIAHQGVLDKGVALLQKPFTPAALARKLRQVLDEPDVLKPHDAQKTPAFNKTPGGKKRRRFNQDNVDSK
jgi:PAS domain S-box-containing protein